MPRSARRRKEEQNTIKTSPVLGFYPWFGCESKTEEERYLFLKIKLSTSISTKWSFQDMVIDKDIFKNNLITPFPCFTLPKTDMGLPKNRHETT